MPKYVIEQVIPGVGRWSAAQLKAASQISCVVLKELGEEIAWLQSYVTDDKLYSIYNSPNETLVRDHANRSGFPVGSVAEVKTMIGPFTAEDGN